MNGEQVLLRSTFITGAGVGGLGTPSWSSSEGSSGTKVVPDSEVRVEVEEEGAGLGGRKNVELPEERNCGVLEGLGQGVMGGGGVG